MLPSPSSDWDSLCVEHALQNSSMDWCSSDWTQHSCPFSAAAIWGTSISSQLLYVFNSLDVSLIQKKNLLLLLHFYYVELNHVSPSCFPCTGSEAWTLYCFSCVYHSWMLFCRAWLLKAWCEGSSERALCSPIKGKWCCWSGNFTSRCYGYAVCVLCSIYSCFLAFVKPLLNLPGFYDILAGTISFSIQHWCFQGKSHDLCMASR